MNIHSILNRLLSVGGWVALWQRKGSMELQRRTHQHRRNGPVNGAATALLQGPGSVWSIDRTPILHLLEIGGPRWLTGKPLCRAENAKKLILLEQKMF